MACNFRSKLPANIIHIATCIYTYMYARLLKIIVCNRYIYNLATAYVTRL